MTKQEFNSLDAWEPPLICGGDLENQLDRTLLWGYTSACASWHVYLEAGVIHTVTYAYGSELEERPVTSNADYVPDKRVYPEACDFEFCRLLAGRGVVIPYDYPSFSDGWVEQQYYGKTLSPSQKEE